MQREQRRPGVRRELGEQGRGVRMQNNTITVLLMRLESLSKSTTLEDNPLRSKECISSLVYLSHDTMRCVADHFVYIKGKVIVCLCIF